MDGGEGKKSEVGWRGEGTFEETPLLREAALENRSSPFRERNL